MQLDQWNIIESPQIDPHKYSKNLKSPNKQRKKQDHLGS